MADAGIERLAGILGLNAGFGPSIYRLDYDAIFDDDWDLLRRLKARTRPRRVLRRKKSAAVLKRRAANRAARKARRSNRS